MNLSYQPKPQQNVSVIELVSFYVQTRQGHVKTQFWAVFIKLKITSFLGKLDSVHLVVIDFHFFQCSFEIKYSPQIAPLVFLSTSGPQPFFSLPSYEAQLSVLYYATMQSNDNRCLFTTTQSTLISKYCIKQFIIRASTESKVLHKIGKNSPLISNILKYCLSLELQRFTVK